ncbi:allantoate deiminase [Paenibacillus chartarius]|uniref:Allantoate deiminase n=1 Tax=Paenibacillus chartarius TaxID=747481 RepID=A0ABV6DH22_9BACL
MDIGADDFAELSPLLEELAGFSESGGPGVTRLLYTKAWLDAQMFLAERMRSCGLEVRFDRVGNLYGRLAGSMPGASVVLTGSHIDTVRAGGRFDGAYGIAAGLLAVARLKEVYGTPVRPLEVVSFCEEEGSRFPLAYWGSGNVSGMYAERDGSGIFDHEGISLEEAMREAGFGLSSQPDSRRSDIGAFVELHIEQGVVLERMGRRIGLVESIVGQRRYSLTLSGKPNHAGTTPMKMRRDALAGAAEIMLELEERAWHAGDPLVATVGRIEATPNTPNVIAGEVRFTLDIRHDDELELERFSQGVLDASRFIAESRQLTLDIRSWLQTAPVQMDSQLVKVLQGVSAGMGITSRRMASGAGHDAQVLAGICPSAMLFVQSRDGISHSPEEYTMPEHLQEGAAVLANCLRQLAYGEEGLR